MRFKGNLSIDWLHIGPYAGEVNAPVATGSTSSSSGGAKHPAFLIGNTRDLYNLPTDFAKYWQLLKENGSWLSVETRQDHYYWRLTDSLYQYTRENKIAFHQMGLISAMKDPSWRPAADSDLAIELEDWISLFCHRYTNVELISVVYGLTDDHRPSLYAKTAFGDNWVLKSYELARSYCPNSILLATDWGLIGQPLDKFANAIMPAVEAGVVDAIGIAVTDMEGYPADKITASLDLMWQRFQLPIYITSFEVSGEDASQLADMKEQFPAYYHHPHVYGITFAEDGTLSPSRALYKPDRTPRPAMVWLKEYLLTHPKN